MQNLKEETLLALEENGKKTSDVRWIGSDGRYISQELFWKIADREYCDGFGGAEVNGCLKIVGDDWWLERGEYDGSEWWEFKTLPTKPTIEASEPLIEFVFNKWYL